MATGVISGKYGVINHRDPNLPVSVTLRQGTRWNILVIASMTQNIRRGVVGATHISLFRGTRPPDDFLTRSDNARYRFSTANPWYTFANILHYKTDTLESLTTFTAQLECDPEPCSDQGQIIILATPSGD